MMLKSILCMITHNYCDKCFHTAQLTSKTGGAAWFLPMSRGSEVKSRMGTGILLMMYSHTTSMLYLSWAEMGMMGAPSATVPVGVWGDRDMAQHSGNTHESSWP